MKQTKQKKPPTPAELLAKANSLPRGVVLSDYLGAMWTLKQEKGFSLREIAAWLSEQLDVRVTHMQVYRAMEGSLPPIQYQTSREQFEETERKRAELEEEAKLEEKADQEEEAKQ